MASWPDDVWENFNSAVGYSTKELATREALQTFFELHSIVQGKVYGMSDVLDNIIDDVPF